MHLLLLIALYSGAPSLGGAKIVMGRQQCIFLSQPAERDFAFPNYRNNGYSQKVTTRADGDQILVSVKNSQLASKMKARIVPRLPTGLRGLERELNDARGGRLADQVSILIHWVRREIVWEAEETGDQSPAAVVTRKSANCVGLSNLTLYVLEKMGVEARYVTGVAFKREDSVELHLKGNVLHRWVEIRYDDVGWVFCDPAGKVNFVDATYMVLGVQNLHPLAELLEQAVNTRIELLRFSNGFKTVGSLAGLDSRIRVRPNRLFTR